MSDEIRRAAQEGTVEWYRGHAAMFLAGLRDGSPEEAVAGLAGCLAAAFERGAALARSPEQPDRYQMALIDVRMKATHVLDDSAYLALRGVLDALAASPTTETTKESDHE
jgi:hypothetical protein